MCVLLLCCCDVYVELFRVVCVCGCWCCMCVCVAVACVCDCIVCVWFVWLVGWCVCDCWLVRLGLLRLMTCASGRVGVVRLCVRVCAFGRIVCVCVFAQQLLVCC